MSVSRFEKRREVVEHTFDPSGQNALIEMMVRDCAEHRRDALFEIDPSTDQLKTFRFSNIASAFSLGDLHPVRTIVEASEIVGDYLSRDTQG